MVYSPLFVPLLPMHIPDGFLSLPVALFFWILTAITIAVALRKINYILGDKRVPLMGVLAAAIFAGQMLNFSVTGGTSGHLLGAALATILLGPWAAILVMTAVVSVQALLFQDGGVLALGANLFNMGLVGVFVAQTVYFLVKKLLGPTKKVVLVAGFAAGWSSIFIAALACAFQLTLSGTSPANLVIPAMAVTHALIGIGEGLITMGALAFLTAARQDLTQGQFLPTAHKGVLWGGGILVLGLLVLAPLASTHPDGLEWVAAQQGFLGQAQAALYELLPNYLLPGVTNPTLATMGAGILGALIVFGLVLGINKLEKKVMPLPPKEKND